MLKSVLNIAPQLNVSASLVHALVKLRYTNYGNKAAVSVGAAKRKGKKQRIVSKAKGKRTLEELG